MIRMQGLIVEVLRRDRGRLVTNKLLTRDGLNVRSHRQPHKGRDGLSGPERGSNGPESRQRRFIAQRKPMVFGRSGAPRAIQDLRAIHVGCGDPIGPQGGTKGLGPDTR
jgi:hypothetical protein